VTFEELLYDVANAARENKTYTLPADDLLVWLEDLQDRYDTEARLGRELGYEPGEQPALSDLVAQARRAAGQGLRPNAVVLDGTGRAYRLIPVVEAPGHDLTSLGNTLASALVSALPDGVQFALLLRTPGLFAADGNISPDAAPELLRLVAHAIESRR